ncbi:SpaA isopeptide-forming pilin-related protein [Corynebacterium gottingense]|uniref:SpaA isopeptide-forming pilin-related protein n=2 Tax=Corynebacterium gottingense TaxID=2041036 RepID=UPI0011C404C6|nr:SpaA isopeptide-forming pilin-related protein [Corynebacterium gottingense]WJZ13926.1 hypothetical protein CGOTT_10145 [Corynebacterium gottingense]WJZ16241.1 hypothetical protein CGOTTB_10095 [Corynebacterium gottingense]
MRIRNQHVGTWARRRLLRAPSVVVATGVLLLGATPATVADPYATAQESANVTAQTADSTEDTGDGAWNATGTTPIDASVTSTQSGKGADAPKPANPVATEGSSAPTSQDSAPAPAAPGIGGLGTVGDNGASISNAPITVERDGNVDTVRVHDPWGELWQWGGAASTENVFALTRDGEVAEVLSVTADGRDLDARDFGWANTAYGAFLGFDLNALHTIPPVDVTMRVRAGEAGEYRVAESDEIPAKREFMGFAEGEETVAPGARAATPYAATSTMGLPAGQAWSVEQKLATTATTTGTAGLPARDDGDKEPMGFGGVKRFMRTTASGSRPDTVIPAGSSPTLAVTRIRVMTTSPSVTFPVGKIALLKNTGSWYSLESAKVTPIVEGGVTRGYDIQLFDPETDTLYKKVDIWSGNQLAVSFEKMTGIPPASNYALEVYASHPVTQESAGDYAWGDAGDPEKRRTTVTPSGADGIARARVTRTTQEDGVLEGEVAAAVKAQNGYSLDGGETLTITGPDGKVLYTCKAGEDRSCGIAPIPAQGQTDGAGGVKFTLPQRLYVPKGSTVAVAMDFRKDPSLPVADQYLRGPAGPIQLDYMLTPGTPSDLTVTKRNALSGDPAVARQLRAARDAVRATGADPADYRFWAIDLKNVGTTDVPGATLTDTLPPGFDPATASALPAALIDGKRAAGDPLTSKSGTADGTLTITVGALRPGETARVLAFARATATCTPNTVTARNTGGELTPADNVATAPCPMQLRVRKVDHQDRTVALEAGLELRPLIDAPSSPIPLTPTPDGFLTTGAALERGREYQLVETKAPAGYSLLAEPIVLRVVREGETDVIEFRGPDGAFSQESPMVGLWTGASGENVQLIGAANTVSVSLANVRQGNLPKTGGAGLMVWVGVASIMLSAGFCGLWRRGRRTG